MDQDRFDDIAKALGSGASRRQLLRGIVGGAAAAVLGAFGRAGGARATHTTCAGVGSSCGTLACCSGSYCDPYKKVCKCGSNGQGCDSTHPCCKGFYCDPYKKICKCGSAGQACDSTHPCCKGYQCDPYKKVCKPACVGAGSSCEAPHPCCSGSYCDP